jgi:hypothetical protein
LQELQELNVHERLILFYRENPVIAAQEIFGIELTWFQRIAINKFFNSKFVMYLMSRGLSKSWTTALVLSLYAILYPKTKIGIVAPSYRQTWYVLDYIDEFLQNSVFFRNCAVTKTVARGNMRSIIRFKNGSYIEALPVGTGEKIRGRRYHVVVIDEAGYMDDDIIRNVIMPMMNIKKKGHENKLLWASTATYAFQSFYGTYVMYKYKEMEDPNYAVCEFNIDDMLAIPDPPFSLDLELINSLKNDPGTTEEQFNMEYYCKFPVEMQNFISAALIGKCTPSAYDEQHILRIDGEQRLFEGSPIEIVGSSDGFYVAGVDVARSANGDNFCIAILKIDEGTKTELGGENVFRFVNCFADNGLTFQEMIEIIRIYYADFRLLRIYMDKSGGGSALEDFLLQPWQDPRTGIEYPRLYDPNNKELKVITGVPILSMQIFSQQFVSLMYHSLKASMQNRRFLFPIDRRKDPNKNLEKISHNIIQTKQELVQLRAEPKGPYVHFPVGSKQKKDRATAVALANLAALEFKKDVLIENSLFKKLPMGRWANANS